MQFVACGTSEVFDPDMNYSLMTDLQTGQPLKIKEQPEEETKMEENKGMQSADAHEVSSV